MAAGGIVIRRIADSVEVLLVHRPRYDDWSLPKGHVDPGEAAVDAAVREVREETGYQCVPALEVGANEYTTSSGIRKLVRYWLMEPTGGRFTPNDEVDEIRWTSPDQALSLLSYDLDRDLIRTSLGTG